MSLVELLAHPAARLLTLALAHFLWQGLVIAALLVAAVELLGIRRTTLRYACSLAALVAMLACPLVTLGWLGLSSTQLSTTPNLSAADFAASDDSNAPAAADLTSLAIADWLARWQPLALAAWLAGVSLFGGRLLAGAIGLERLRRSRQPLPLDLATLVERLGARLRMNALPLVFVSRQVSEAMAVGLLRPLVLIPAAWVTELPLPMLEAVIAHELAHLRRRDLWINLLQRLAETLLFYHPAVWWLSQRLRAERELCADELAVAATGRRLEYAQALEQVAHRRQAEVRPALAAFMRGDANMRVLQRVRNVLGLAGGERPSLWPVGLAALALPGVLAAAALSLSAQEADKPKEADKPAVQRDGDRPDAPKDGERKVEIRFFKKADAAAQDGPRRDGDRPKDGARDGDRPREGARDGDRPREGDRPVLRDGERKVIRRDGEAPKEGPRDGEPRREVFERKINLERPDGGDARIEELTALVRRLSQQVERLQAEVNAIRGGKQPAKKEGAFGSEDPVTGKGAISDPVKPARKEDVKEAIKIPAIEGANLREYREEAIRRLKEAAGDKEVLKERAAELKEAAVRRLKEAAVKEQDISAIAEKEAARAKELATDIADKVRAEAERRRAELIKERAATDKEAAERDRELIERKKAAAAEAEKKAAEEKKEKESPK